MRLWFLIIACGVGGGRWVEQTLAEWLEKQEAGGEGGGRRSGGPRDSWVSLDGSTFNPVVTTTCDSFPFSCEMHSHPAWPKGGKHQNTRLLPRVQRWDEMA